MIVFLQQSKAAQGPTILSPYHAKHYIQDFQTSSTHQWPTFRTSIRVYNMSLLFSILVITVYHRVRLSYNTSPR